MLLSLQSCYLQPFGKWGREGMTSPTAASVFGEIAQLVRIDSIDILWSVLSNDTWYVINNTGHVGSGAARYSEGSLFRKHKFVYLDMLEVRQSENGIGFIDPNICSVIPKVCYSEGSLLRRVVIPEVRFSEWWNRVRYSEGSLIRKWNKVR